MNARETVLRICQERLDADTPDFWPSYITQETGIPAIEVVKILKELVTQGLLLMGYELLCSSCGQRVEYLDADAETMFFDGRCLKCGRDIYAAEDSYIPVYTPVKASAPLSLPGDPGDPRLRNSLLAG